MIKKSFISAVLCAVFLISTIPVSASVLGSVLINGYEIEIGPGLEAVHNTWYSDQSGVGQQTENYLTYAPNDEAEPIITNGDYVFGRKSVTNEIARLRENGIVPLAGTNADFFSLQTGVPMSNIISDGKIVSKDSTKQYGIGILQDNSAFMSEFKINSVLKKEDGTEFEIQNINKYRQPYSIYMMTDKFSTETHNNTKGIDVILGNVEGEIKLGEKITAVVEYVEEYEGSIAIPEGKIVLTVDSNAPVEMVSSLMDLKIDDKVEIDFTLEGDERWLEVKTGIGATGDMLIENGEINSGFEAGANPRTALGIKENGSIILYTIDGRNKGYSYGVQLKTLALRMKELGCTDAINLDGGGSTTFVLQFPGDNTTTLNNKPSDGSTRKVSNFIFFKNNLNYNGGLDKLTLYPLTSYVLKGASLKFTTKASDKNYYGIDVPNNLEFYTVENALSTIDSSGVFTAKDTGKVRIYVKSGTVVGSTDVVCVESPTDIKIINENTNKQIDSVKIKRNETISLTADAYAGYNKLEETDKNFVWKCDSEIGSIDSDGNFTAGDVLNVKGNIYVSAGETTVKIPVSITRNGSENIDEMYTNATITENDGFYRVVLDTKYGIEVDKNNIILKINGKTQNFEFANNEITFTIDTVPSSITLYITNLEGLTTFLTVKNDNVTTTSPFIDVSGHWAENVTGFMYQNKIINGENTAEGLKFNPNKFMTRAEFAVMMTNYLGLNTADYTDIELPYKDLKSVPAWALDSFKALYKEGILKGATGNDGLLYGNPLNNITRAETAVIISRTLPEGLMSAEITTDDKDEIADWAREGFEILYGTGAIKGYEDGTIRPLRNVTKAEAAKILYTII